MIVLEGALCFWVVYDRPLDAPDEAVARLFRLDQPTDNVIHASNVEALRLKIQKRYPDLDCIPRQHGDEPHIVETWL